MKICEVCEGSLSEIITAKEMMLGYRHEFDYGICQNCGTIQILDQPESIADYYPSYYYSFKEEVPKIKPLPLIKKLVQNWRMKKKYRQNRYDQLRWFKPLGVMPSDRILDIGCGNGKLICQLFNIGFQNVQGVDKFVNSELNYGHGVKVFKKDLSELPKGSYNILMMHHVFEHMDEPLEILKKSYALLKKDGYLIIRIPKVGKAWKIYREKWVQLDAPRHFFIHTEESMAVLAKKSGFSISNIIYDSVGFQFWGSELYRRDIPLVDEETKEYRRPEGYFSEGELAEYEHEAQLLNVSREADQAVFYLRKI